MDGDKKEKANESSFLGKRKIIFMAVGALVSLVIFIVILITPLMALGIIDIGSGSSSGNSSLGYSSVTSNTTFWWPIGSMETDTINGVIYAGGEPAETIITSGFELRNDPYSGAPANHYGVDIAPLNYYELGDVNVIASKKGTVIYPWDGAPTDCPSSSEEDNCGDSYGNYVMIDHGDGYVTLYGHLYENSILVKAGDTVEQGQVIANVGSSGRSTGAHLHFEVRVNGERVNPLNYITEDEPRNPETPHSNIVGADNKQTVCLVLKDLGLPDNGIAAIMVNMYKESTFDPTIYVQDDNGGPSYGLCQWHNDRYANLMSSFPNTYHLIGSQIDYLMYELVNTYTGVYGMVTDGTSSTSDITYKFCTDFEVSDDRENVCRDRADDLSSSYETYVKNGCK